jgi:protein-L-isoaspartate(D-aspartate) O-methyltransferase
MDFALARSNMIEQQIRPWDVLDQRVLDALATLPRENFIPELHRKLAYSDTRIPLDDRGYSLNPNIEARLLQAAVLESDDRTLIIGSGSGYLAACAALLCKHVEAIDDSQAANDRASANAEQCGVDNIKFITGDLIADLPDKTTYDAIIVNGSMQSVPAKLKNRLTLMGRLVVTVGSDNAPVMEAQVIRRISEDDWLVQSIFDTHIPPVGEAANTAPETAGFKF